MNSNPSPLTNTQPIASTRNVLLILGIIFVAFNLRHGITSVGPLVGVIRQDLGLSNSVAGLLTTLPILALGFLSAVAPYLGKKLGNEFTIFLGLCIIAAGILLRSSGLISMLFIGTTLVGVGIAIGNVLLPPIIKQHFAKIGLLTGMYVVCMGSFAGLGAGLSVPLSEDLGLGWQKALAVWSAITFAAIIIWIPQIRKNQTKAAAPSAKGTGLVILRSGLAWQVTIFMGLQSYIFYSLIAWLPDILVNNGMSMTLAGWLVSLLPLAGLPATFTVPILADYFKDQKLIVAIIGLVCIVGLIGLYFGGNIILITFYIILLALATGASVSLSLAFIGLRAKDAGQAASLSGMSQSIGYFLAATGPFTLGFLYDIFGNWESSILLMIIVCIIMTIAGIGAGRNKYVLD